MLPYESAWYIQYSLGSKLTHRLCHLLQSGSGLQAHVLHASCQEV